MKKFVMAIDSFKGCLTSVEANQAATDGILLKMADAEVIQIPAFLHHKRGLLPRWFLSSMPVPNALPNSLPTVRR